jgi:hypothetical protein
MGQTLGQTFGQTFHQTSPKKSLHFIVVPNKQAAQHLLDNAEQKDFYLQQCHDDKRNDLARRHMTYSANLIRPEESQQIQGRMNTFLEKIPRKLRIDLHDISFIQLMPTADGGMPHTRPGNVVCYAHPSSLSFSTVVHELWHIHQRAYQDLWTYIFQQLGWRAFGGDLPASLEDCRRYNPDTIDSPLWVYKETWVPIPIFRDSSNPNVGETDIWFYHMTQGYHVKKVPDDLASYYKGAPINGFEHPREMTAYILSEPDHHPDMPAFNDLLALIGHISIAP